MKPIYSLVIPLKNEEGNIANLISEIEDIMNSLNSPWELICIDDGSTDLTLTILKDFAHKKSYLRVIVFNNNYGQSCAFDAGFKMALGEFVITLDGDGQNDPADIPKLIALIESCDLVCGIRSKRQDSWSKRLISKIANRVRNWICDDGIDDTGCSLKVYRKVCLEKIKMYKGMHRFLPALFKIEGFRLKQTPVNHRQRVTGVSNYNLLNRSFNTIADLFAVKWMKKRQINYKIDHTIL